MKYRKLGETNLLVSELSFGSWVTFQEGGQVAAAEKAYELMKAAYDGGVNFFDGAEAYGNGDQEILMGEAIKMGLEKKAWEREDLVISTKIFFGAIPPRKSEKYIQGRKLVNKMGLSRKHIVEGVMKAKKRLQLDVIDLVFCHRFDPIAIGPEGMEEVVRAYNELIARGDIYYWGTSEWTAQQIELARGVAKRLGLIPPCFDQPEYNLFQRNKVEVEFAPLYPHVGLTIWSPLASGILTGKYKDGLPTGSRLAMEEFKRRPDYKVFMKKIEVTEKLRPIADRLNVSMGTLALAWCLKNPNVSSVIMGASSLAQLKENLSSAELVDKLTPEIMKEINSAIGTKPRLPRETQQAQFRLRPLRTKL